MTNLAELKDKAAAVQRATRELNMLLSEARQLKGLRIEMKLLNITECDHVCAQHLLMVELTADLGLVTE